MTVRDAKQAIAIAEGAVSQRVLLATDGVEPSPINVFGERVVVERGRDVPALVNRSAALAASGERVALVASARDLTAARDALAHIAARRLGLVVHCLDNGPEGVDAPSDLGSSSALSLADLPWGMLVAVGAAESLDLSLVARRAAEDSGCPFFVVHEKSSAATSRRSELLVAPTREMGDSFLGGARLAPPPGGDLRAVGARVPFALASALREMEALSVRRLDVLERAPAGDASLALVGFGATGEAMVGQVARLRAGGHEVAAVRVVAWRPFPGPRLVKALSRAVAVCVIDAVDRPLSGSPLGVELKAAFSDALTWAPGYPGIGRIPRIVSGVCPPGRAMTPRDVDALLEHLSSDDRAERTVVLDRG